MPTRSPAHIVMEALLSLPFTSSAGSLRRPDGTLGPVGYFTLYLGKMPDIDAMRDTAIAFYDIPGMHEGRLMSGEAIEKPGVQIKVRARDYNAAYQMAYDIAKWCDAIKYGTQVVINPGPNADTYVVHNMSRYTNLMNSGNQTGRENYENFHFNMRLTLAPR